MVRYSKAASVIAFFLIGAVGTVDLSAQNPSQLDNLKEPRIVTRKDERMLVVEATGDPNVVGGKAFSHLFQLYYAMKETPKGPGQGVPRARWPESLDHPKSEWTGYYALPVPETVTELPIQEAPAGLRVLLTTWKYGEVAELLHAGPYDKEEPTFERLKSFIKSRGYETVGGHEEEYIKGPTMSGKGDPEAYLTIIRYRVQRAHKTQ
ncbi:MAG TPA: GyrI-like domain-containing protein [Blastocatellia bacterium]|nr:GyrI-like domain-containing protein [Blastocatellia bacterium]